MSINLKEEFRKFLIEKINESGKLFGFVYGMSIKPISNEKIIFDESELLEVFIEEAMEKRKIEIPKNFYVQIIFDNLEKSNIIITSSKKIKKSSKTPKLIFINAVYKSKEGFDIVFNVDKSKYNGSVITFSVLTNPNFIFKTNFVNLGKNDLSPRLEIKEFVYRKEYIDNKIFDEYLYKNYNYVEFVIKKFEGSCQDFFDLKVKAQQNNLGIKVEYIGKENICDNQNEDIEISNVNNLNITFDTGGYFTGSTNKKDVFKMNKFIVSNIENLNLTLNAGIVAKEFIVENIKGDLDFKFNRTASSYMFTSSVNVPDRIIVRNSNVNNFYLGYDFFFSIYKVLKRKTNLKEFRIENIKAKNLYFYNALLSEIMFDSENRLQIKNVLSDKFYLLFRKNAENIINEIISYSNENTISSKKDLEENLLQIFPDGILLEIILFHLKEYFNYKELEIGFEIFKEGKFTITNASKKIDYFVEFFSKADEKEKEYFKRFIELKNFLIEP